MKTCKTCKYFRESNEICRIGYCTHEKIIYSDPHFEEVSSDCFYYYDLEGYQAFHFVGPDFGCIHHESKKIRKVVEKL